jgi:hypothetical protein
MKIAYKNASNISRTGPSVDDVCINLGFFARKRDFHDRMIFGKLIGNSGRTGSSGVFSMEPANAREWASNRRGSRSAIQDA